MLISTKGRYGLRIMVELAGRPDQEAFVPLHDLADQQGISEKYLESILRSLVAAGYLEGRRGKGGGYRLTQEAHTISVYDVLQMAEPSLAPVSCLDPEEREACERRDICKTLPLWEALDQKILDFLKSVTLEDVLQGQIP